MDMKGILKFLSDLRKNNDRRWFEKNKGRYLEAKQAFEDFVAELLQQLSRFDDRVAGLDAKKLPFRIYRDIRFSRDKRPYKENMGAGISPNGKLIQEPGYYIHIQPGGKSFVAGGIYMPNAENLAKVRQEIDYNGVGLDAIMKNRTFKTLFGGFDDFDRVKTAPKGYDKEHPRIEMLKNRSFIVSQSFSDKEVVEKAFVKRLSATCKAIKPLNDFLREALE